MTKMDDRNGVMMCSALLLIAATQGTDADVKQAAKLDVPAMAYLAGKYAKQACDVVRVTKLMMEKVTGDNSGS